MTMSNLKISLLFLCISLSVYSQKVDVEYKTMVADPDWDKERGRDISAMELSPDKKTLVIATSQGPLLVWNVATEKMIKKIDIDGYGAGPRVEYGRNGKYLLLQKTYYTDNNLNKDRTSKIDIIDIESGKVIFNKPAVHDATLSYDCKYVLTLAGPSVEIYDVVSGNLVRSIPVEEATNAVAISNDGKTVAVSHKLRKDDIADIPSIRDDKKTIKAVLKFRQGISFYDFSSGKRMKTCSDIFDAVYSMRYTEDGKRILVYNVANTKLQAGNEAGGRQGYVSQIDAVTGEVLRTIVPSQISEPDYKESPNNKYLGVSSAEIGVGKFLARLVPTVLIYDIETGDMIHKFEVNLGYFKDKAMITGTPMAFVFLPDNNTIWLNYGGKIAVWTLPK